MALQTLLNREKHMHFWYPMPSQDVTRCPFRWKGREHIVERLERIPEATRVFLAMIDRQVTEDTLATFQQFVGLMYDCFSAQANVNATRQVLIARNSKSWKASHLRRLSLNNMPNKQNIGLAMCGHRVSIKTHLCQVRWAEDGREKATNPGRRSGLHSRKPRTP
jgi:hypothetical protein